MKVLAIVGSPRATGNTSVLVDRALEVISDAGIETEKILLGLMKKSIDFYQKNIVLGHENCFCHKRR